MEADPGTTMNRLDALKARLVAAKPGPWMWNQVKGFGARCWLWATPLKQQWLPIAELTGAGIDTWNFIAHSRDAVRP